jgi:hypothetical protein
MIAFATSTLRNATNGQVVAFCCAAGKDNFTSACANRCRNCLPGAFDRVARGPAVGMAGAGGIAVDLAEVRQHRFHDARIYAGGGMIIEIDRTVQNTLSQSETALNRRRRSLAFRERKQV